MTPLGTGLSGRDPLGQQWWEADVPVRWLALAVLLGSFLLAVLRNLAHSTEELAHRGMDLVRDKSLHVRDTTTHYIQDEPVKSMLIAAAVGAALIGLVAMFSRSGSHANGYRSQR